MLDHSRIARFIRHRLYGEVMENLLYQFVFILQEMGEVAFENTLRIWDGQEKDLLATLCGIPWSYA